MKSAETKKKQLKLMVDNGPLMASNVFSAWIWCLYSYPGWSQSQARMYLRSVEK